MKLSKKDFLFSVITGFYTGFIAWRVFEFLEIPKIGHYIYCIIFPCPSGYIISWAWLMLVIPVLWILGVNLGYFLGRWLTFFNQFGKFSAIGFTNAAVDLGILNLLISYFSASAGILFSLFKGISFTAAAIHSYFWNKYWAFEADGNGISGQEFFKFFGVTVFAGLINVLIASIVVNLVGPQFGLSGEAWANVGAVAGSAVALVASFIGFRMFVFKK